jgi:uncharacterized protein YutE (UPF0331/DUF86 family)
MNDIVINKVQSIQRCIDRAREEYRLAGSNFANDFSRQDAAILNITRACEQAIDLANYVIKSRKMGIPMSSKESFELLARKNVISPAIEQKMINMVGFRNIAVHQYQKLNIAMVEAIIVSELDDLTNFGDSVQVYLRSGPA